MLSVISQVRKPCDNNIISAEAGINAVKTFRVVQLPEGLLQARISEVLPEKICDSKMNNCVVIILILGMGVQFSAAESILEMLEKRTQYSKVNKFLVS